MNSDDPNNYVSNIEYISLECNFVLFNDGSISSIKEISIAKSNNITDTLTSKEIASLTKEELTRLNDMRVLCIGPCGALRKDIYIPYAFYNPPTLH